MTIRKRFGQHFLRDPNVIRRIVDTVKPSNRDHIVEIGPGRGAITEALISSGCDLDVIEIDRDLVDQLRRRYDGQIKIHSADALKFDFRTLDIGAPFRIIGNLPYNISTPLLFRLYSYTRHIQDMVFMLQEEVVNRICAAPGTSDYGRLSVMSQYHCLATKQFSIPPSAFTPQPRVTSAIIRLTPHPPSLRLEDHTCLQEVVAAAFGQRRKTIRNALKKLLRTEDLELLEIDAGLRPEQLTLDDYITCANFVARQRQT